MSDKLEFTRLLIGDIWLEKDIYDEPRLVMKDELGQEWSLSEKFTSDGYVTAIKKKNECQFFDESKREKKLTSF